MGSGINRYNALRVALFIATFVLCGCDDDFYLSEAEVQGYRWPLYTAAQANSTFSNLKDQLLTIQFSGSTSPLQITSSNLLDVIRNGTLLPAFELTNRQIDLSRLSVELERQLQNLVSQRLSFFQGDSDEHVRVEQLTSLMIRFRSNPIFNYDAATQTISASFVIRMAIQGSLRVHGVDNWLSRLLLGPIDGLYPMGITVD